MVNYQASIACSMDLLPAELQDAAILRRIIFAAAYLPKDVPHYWSIVGQFSAAKLVTQRF